jgi:hypothetical protein
MQQAAAQDRFSALRVSRRHVIPMVAVILVAALTAVWLRGHGQAPSVSALGGHAPAVTGTVVIEGGPPALNSGGSDVRPVPAAHLVVTGTTTAGAHLVRRLTTDAHGHFRLALLPGHYVVTARIFGPANRSLAEQPHAAVVVRQGHPIQVQIKGIVQ